MAAVALKNQMNRVVRVNRIKLIETLKANRVKHINDFNETMDGYKASALKKVDEAFSNLEERLQKQKTEIVKHINTFTVETAGNFSDWMTILQAVQVNLKVPVSYEDSYDAAIDMATYDVREELDLSGAEFNCFVRDMWDWTQDFSLTNAFYKAAK